VAFFSWSVHFLLWVAPFLMCKRHVHAQRRVHMCNEKYTREIMLEEHEEQRLGHVTVDSLLEGHVSMS
jgi:hypothetical protein